MPSDNSLCSLRFSTEGMLKIINNLDSDKAHSSEDISVRMLRPLLFLIFINDLAEILSSNQKLFANGTSLFSVVRDLIISEYQMELMTT